ncbi:MAG: hypothetical protein CVV53_04715 [Spirochaetae bacterium HGW-Spirochaetae-9]|nr:MAG: hypothetical protein CVV53_04715 [Spirochaetae bacterium HGW-Spirochaetae-9]
MKTNAGLFLVLAATTLFAAGCGIPFDIETPTKTIELPNTGGTYFDKVVDLPEEARKPGITFETVSLIYTVRKQSGFVAHVKLYASPDQVTHLSKPSNAEELLDISLAGSDTSKSGTEESQTIRDVLNAKQESFVIGAENLTSSPLSTIYIDISLRLQGKFGL